MLAPGETKDDAVEAGEAAELSGDAEDSAFELLEPVQALNKSDAATRAVTAAQYRCILRGSSRQPGPPCLARLAYMVCI
jgi:hypothetical protein